MQGPAQSVSGSLQSVGPQPVNIVAGILLVLVRQQAELLQMLRPLVELSEMQLTEKVAELDGGKEVR